MLYLNELVPRLSGLHLTVDSGNRGFASETYSALSLTVQIFFLLLVLSLFSLFVIFTTKMGLILTSLSRNENIVYYTRCRGKGMKGRSSSIGTYKVALKGPKHCAGEGAQEFRYLNVGVNTNEAIRKQHTELLLHA